MSIRNKKTILREFDETRQHLEGKRFLENDPRADDYHAQELIDTMQTLAQDMNEDIAWTKMLTDLYLPILEDFVNLASKVITASSDSDRYPKLKDLYDWLRNQWAADRTDNVFYINSLHNGLLSRLYAQNNIIQNKSNKDLFERLDSLSNTITQAATERVADEYVNVYTAEAKRNHTSSVLWIIATAILVIVLFVILDYFNDIYPTQKKGSGDVYYKGLLANYFIAKAFTLSVLIFMLTWCLKQFRVHRHLFTLNKNKAVALSSFATFRLIIKNEELRETVTMEIAKIIFDPGTTGYMGEKENSDIPNIVNTIGSFKSPI